MNYPWRARLAGWPTAWRKEWGVRANRAEDRGVPWMEAERLAFEEVARMRRDGVELAEDGPEPVQVALRPTPAPIRKARTKPRRMRP